MVGLSIVLESQKGGGNSKKVPQVINKTTLMMIPNNNPFLNSYSPRRNFPRFQPPDFLDHCFLCNQKLLPGKDIYMYKGDMGFCSVECRCRQIFMDEEESVVKDHCSLAAMKPNSTSSSSSSSADSRHRKATGNQPAGGFAY